VGERPRRLDVTGRCRPGGVVSRARPDSVRAVPRGRFPRGDAGSALVSMRSLLPGSHRAMRAGTAQSITTRARRRCAFCHRGAGAAHRGTAAAAGGGPEYQPEARTRPPVVAVVDRAAQQAGADGAADELVADHVGPSDRPAGQRGQSVDSSTGSSPGSPWTPTSRSRIPTISIARLLPTPTVAGRRRRAAPANTRVVAFVHPRSAQRPAKLAPESPRLDGPPARRGHW